MKKVPSTVVKKRSRELTTVFESFVPYVGMEGKVERIWITEFATDGVHLVRCDICVKSFFNMHLLDMFVVLNAVFKLVDLGL